MKKSDFLEAKLTYMMKFPHVTDLAYYRYYTNTHPEAGIGWLYLGKEWEKKGNLEQALLAYKRGVSSQDQEGVSQELSDTYFSLLWKKRKNLIWKRFRTGTAVFLTLMASLLPFPTKTGEGNLPVSNSLPPEQARFEHTEVIAVPEQANGQDLENQVLRYSKSRRTNFISPFTIIVVPGKQGVPLFTPLLFASPQNIKGVVHYDPVHQRVLWKKWLTPECNCQQDKAVTQARDSFQREQLETLHVLTLRNTLYRYYQRNHQLPGQLSELTKPFPDNELPSVPKYVSTFAPVGNWYTYQPELFMSNDSWLSLARVVPMIHHPEPTIPLAPLQIVIHKPSYSMTVMSGPHVVRQYKIGLGRNDATPSGFFSIQQKINHPLAPESPVYGSRGLIFATSYAIHGTNDPESIGQAFSLGCVRMYNQDVEELYSIASKGTEVVISSNLVPTPVWPNPSRFIMPADKDEETPKTIYHWLH